MDSTPAHLPDPVSPSPLSSSQKAPFMEPMPDLQSRSQHPAPRGHYGLINWSLALRLGKQKTLSSLTVCAIALTVSVVLAAFGMHLFTDIVVSDIPNEIRSITLNPATTSVVLPILLGVTIAIVISAFVEGATSGGTSRTFLGAGMKRASIVWTNIVSWVVPSFCLALISLAVSLGVMANNRDFSGDLRGSESFRAHFGRVIVDSTTPLHGFWWVFPLLVFGWLMFAHWIGYVAAMIFVRIHWSIPVILLILGPNLISWIWVWLKLPQITIPMAHVSDPMMDILLQGLQVFLYSAVVGGLAVWLLMRRLPIRR